MALEIVDLRARMPNYGAYKGWQRPGPIFGIAIHHSGYATVDPVTGAPNVTPRQIFDYHVNTLGWAHGGYNYIIGSDGTISYVLDERIPPYHCGLSEPDKVKEPQKWQQWASLENGQYFNNHYIAICLLGWFSRNRVLEGNGARTPIPDANTTPTEAQWTALIDLIRDIRNRYRISIEKIQGHRELRATVNFGSTDCPGRELDLEKLRRSVEDGEAPDPPPPEPFVRNRPLVGLHARNDRIFTPVDYEIVRQARVESMKTLSLLGDEVYARLRSINPRMEFIVRLYKHMPRGSVPSPQQFVDEFQPTIERLHARFGILKFEIHNEPNHLTGLEGWGQTEQDARAFQEWYVSVFTILKQRNPWALFGYPGLAVPHNDLEWLDWTRDAIEMSDWLGCHVYWQTPPHAPFTFRDDFWGGRFKAYHAKYPHKLIEITEFGNSNGHDRLRLSEEEKAEQYVWWLTAIQQFPYIGSAHAFLATSPDPTWVDQRFPWGDPGSGQVFHVAPAIGERVVRLPLPPDWQGLIQGFDVAGRVSAGSQVELAGTVANAGRLPWRCSGLSRTSLVAWWTDTAGEQVGEMQSFALPTDMAPSDELPMRLQVESPERPGEYMLCLDLYHSGFDQWLSVLGPGEGLVQPATVHEPLPPWHAEWIAHLLPERRHARERIEVTVVIRNAGSRVWPGAGSGPERVHLGYSWLPTSGRRLSPEDRTPLPRDVAPGEQIEIGSLPVQLPAEPGRYQLRFDLVSEAAGWFGEQGSPPLAVDVTVQPAPPALAFEWLLVEAERVMIAGQPAPLTVKVRNTGGETWLAATPDGSGVTRFGYRWSTPDGSPVEVAGQPQHATFPHDVAPGEIVTIRDLPVVPPGVPGHYRLDLGLVKAGVSWFPDPAPNAGNLLVEVSPQPVSHGWGVEQEPRAMPLHVRSPAYAVEYLRHTVPARLAPDQVVTVTLQVRNRGERTWRAGGDTGVALVYRWLKAEEQNASLGGARAPLPHDVPPGATATLAGIALHTPGTPGHYRLRWELLEEGTAWFRDPSLFSLELPVEIAPQARAATSLDTGAVRRLPPRESARGARPASEASVIDASSSELGPRTGWLVSARAGEQGLVWSATASHNPGDAGRAVDADPDAFWSSEVSQYPGMFFQVDLGRLTAIDGVGVLSPGRGFAAGYRIRVSADHVTWTTVAQCGTNHGDIQATFNPVAVRHIRIEQTGRPPAHTPWLIAEIRIHENPLWSADASHHPEQVDLAFDNREETAWTTGAPQTQQMWFTLDMGRQEEVTGFILKSRWHEEYPRGLLLEISPDGNTWERIFEVDENHGDLDVDFPRLFKGRFLSLVQTRESPWYAWTISELVVKRRR